MRNTKYTSTVCTGILQNLKCEEKNTLMPNHILHCWDWLGFFLYNKYGSSKLTQHDVEKMTTWMYQNWSCIEK